MVGLLVERRVTFTDGAQRTLKWALASARGNRDGHVPLEEDVEAKEGFL